MSTKHIALHSTLNVSETGRDRGLVPKDHQQEIWVSIGHATDDVTSPKRSNSWLHAVRSRLTAQYLEKG